MRSLLAIACCLLVGLLATAPQRAAADTTGQTTCRIVTLPVTVASQTGTVDGTLCTPPGATTVQLLVHGWTYDEHYFDWSYQPGRYSYARAANAAGYATLAIDRLAAGGSMQPLSLFDTLFANVRIVHLWVQALRNRTFGTAFQQVVGVGHSLGSITMSVAAGDYPGDFNAMITTGFTHNVNYANAVARVLLNDYPAMSDPKFSSSVSDPLYYTSMPGTRGGFYEPGTYDPQVLATDEQLKAMDSLVDFATVAAYAVDDANRNTNIPVLDVTGQHDAYFCGLGAADCSSSAALAAWEKPYYGLNSTVQAYAVPDTGHDVQLSYASPQATQVMLNFVNHYIGPGSGELNTTPGIRPAVPSPPPAGPPSLLAGAANALFTTLVAPTVATLNSLLSGVPGVGTQQEIIDISGLLSTIAKLANQALGTLPQSLLGTV
jgi:pimeloyl-ACP methyl ester carboxylesterase